MWNNKIPDLQKRIIRFLGENGPATKNKIASSLGKAYKNVAFAMESLHNKRLVEVVGKENYRNQVFPLYWLTLHGVIKTYSLGVEAGKLKMYTLQLVKVSNEMEQMGLNCFFDMLQVVKPAKADKLLTMFRFKGGNTPELASVNLDLLSPEEARTIMKVIKQYEPYRNMLKTTLEKVLSEI
jgi:hypothetical protein